MTSSRPSAEERRLRQENEALRAELAGRSSELGALREQYRGLIEAAPIVTYLDEILPDGEIRPAFMSNQVEQLLGYAPDELLEDQEAWYRHVHPDDRARVAEEDTDHHRTRTGRSREYRMTTRDGRTVWLLDYCSVVPGAQGGLFDQGILMDVTARKEAEAQLRQFTETLEERVAERTAALEHATAAAAEARRARDSLLSRVSHEFRTPLGIIMGFARLLEGPDLTADERESVTEILAAAQRLLRLVDRMLDLTHLEAGKVGLQVEPVDLAGALRDTLLSVRSLADERGVVLSTGHLALHAWVAADPYALSAVLEAMLINSTMRAAHGGRVIALVSGRDGWRRLELRDDGPPLDADRAEDVFRPFTSAIDQGTGLDLAMASRLADAMGGRIEAGTAPGGPTTFSLSLPIAVPVGDAIAGGKP